MVIFCKNDHFSISGVKSTQDQDVFKNQVKIAQSRPFLPFFGPQKDPFSSRNSRNLQKLVHFLGHSSRKWVVLRVKKQYNTPKLAYFQNKSPQRGHFKAKWPNGHFGWTPKTHLGSKTSHSQPKLLGHSSGGFRGCTYPYLCPPKLGGRNDPKIPILPIWPFLAPGGPDRTQKPYEMGPKRTFSGRFKRPENDPKIGLFGTFFGPFGPKTQKSQFSRFK